MASRKLPQWPSQKLEMTLHLISQASSQLPQAFTLWPSLTLWQGCARLKKWENGSQGVLSTG